MLSPEDIGFVSNPKLVKQTKFGKALGGLYLASLGVDDQIFKIAQNLGRNLNLSARIGFENTIKKTSDPLPDPGHFKIGLAIAEVYIAAQEGVSQEASGLMCLILEHAPLAIKLGFDTRMAKSPYNVTALRAA